MEKGRLAGSVLFSLLLVLFAACEKENRECPGSIKKEFSVTDFTRVEAGENFKINIQKGNNFLVKASGCAHDLNDLRLSVGSGNTLDIQYNHYRSRRNRVDFTITLPQLTSVQLSGVSKTTISGFAGQPTVIRNVLSGAAECTLTGTGINTQIDLSGTSRLTIAGTTENLYGNLSGDARLYAYELPSLEVDIATSGTAKAYVQPQQKFFAEASGASRIYYKGAPSVEQVVVSSAAKVIKE